MFINDLAMQLKHLNSGIQIGPNKLNVLLYADDIALIAENEGDMDAMLDVVSGWCRKWRLRINSLKFFVSVNEREVIMYFALGGIVLTIQHPINISVCYSMNLLHLKIIQKISLNPVDVH